MTWIFGKLINRKLTTSHSNTNIEFTIFNYVTKNNYSPFNLQFSGMRYVMPYFIKESWWCCCQGVSYSQKFCSKHGFPNLANSRTSQFIFSKHLMKHQNVKVVKLKFKSKESNKIKHKNNVVLKENKKKNH